jgi:peroxiredoxin
MTIRSPSWASTSVVEAVNRLLVREDANSVPSLDTARIEGFLKVLPSLDTTLMQIEV